MTLFLKYFISLVDWQIVTTVHHIHQAGENPVTLTYTHYTLLRGKPFLLRNRLPILPLVLLTHGPHCVTPRESYTNATGVIATTFNPPLGKDKATPPPNSQAN